MSSTIPIWHQTLPAGPSAEPTEVRWYAIRSRSRAEKEITRQLDKHGIETFLPLVIEVRVWSDRHKKVQLPLFPGYTFVRIDYSSSSRREVLQARGVVGFVGMKGAGIPIPDEQIRDIQTVLANNVPCRDHSYLKVGQRVRVRGGSLNGLEGILVGQKGARNLIISVEPIQRSLSICVEGYEVEAV
jgi:transcription antitermination factor NusG